MADDFEETSNSRVSKINAAALTNLTISDLWKDSYKHSRNAELTKWNADLNCLWMEFAGDVKPGSDDEKQFIALDCELAATGSLGVKKSQGFQELEREALLKLSKQYKLLMKKAIFLKRLQNKQGKGTAYHDDDEDYMD